ncbi:MAG: NADH:ubiquinone reductase (Na(+)-transporting) subunit B [Gemmatimonadetes bacterium]|jgi:Na+-transporting NADH:ubiquinone oxidoreductase subunit B|nr:NADH:ubiquinone reductase (Na(+)-transporting) subunit B [Gemmatimonadota bacterium]MBT4612838.1 NADH:ubiquinone reductase (Na(+)-transporting) subunit B [Gemmatimonadota bacterium]MBT5058908.1 NADH:ubiquinone reductase (Na(+)-transporting) subunit B [Gemmatimonadota bacterium]MBT5144384.1 NADH:ubiquinone reductase (Na(+)-transporting) subunit B [Gemmatimonadota bacterium]MBT5587098.1 NADH:ubiquinone reductase (Na(+)-transporting) subunit B [Gemmatimonadota bacterium]
MKVLRQLLDAAEPHFTHGGKLEKLFPIYELIDTFLFTPADVTKNASHVRDGIDLKRLMITVAVGLIPCIFMAMWNTGYQANLAMAHLGMESADGWRGVIIDIFGIGYDPTSLLANLIHGSLFFVPVFLVCNMVGGFWEAIFASVRGHEVNEGFLVTGILFPLTLPPTIPLWQVAVGISFGVVIGKEIFGGTGKNFLNPALTARAFLYFAYPAQISGDKVWVAIDGYSKATPLGMVPADGIAALTGSMTKMQAFLGTIPGSMGETSVLACLIGAAVLIGSGIGSWRIMLSMTIATVGLGALLHMVDSTTNSMFAMDPMWHLLLGGYAFGCVFMATDPVSASFTNLGKWLYGGLIGVMTILIRVVNPAFPEGVMLAILFGNVFAPVFDYLVVQANVRRRALRTAL